MGSPEKEREITNPSYRYSSLLPPGSSGSGDSCWGSESSPPTFSSSCNNNTQFSRFASQRGCNQKRLHPVHRAALHSQAPPRPRHATTQLLPLHRHAQGCPLHTKARLHIDLSLMGDEKFLSLYATHMANTLPGLLVTTQAYLRKYL